MDVEQRCSEVASELKVLQNQGKGVRQQQVGLPPCMDGKANAFLAGGIPDAQPGTVIEIAFIPASPRFFVRKPFKSVESLSEGIIKGIAGGYRPAGGLVAYADHAVLIGDLLAAAFGPGSSCPRRRHLVCPAASRWLAPPQDLPWQ